MLRPRAWILTTLACLLGAHTASAADDARDVAVADSLDSAPVVVDGIALFQLAGAASFTSKERAESVRKRIIDVARDGAVKSEQIRANAQGGRIDVVAGSRHLVTVSGGDLAIEGATAPEIAYIRVQRIQQAVDRYRAERQPDYISRAVVSTLLATLATAVAVAVTLFVFRRLLAFVKRHVHSSVRGAAINSLEIMNPDKVSSGISTALRILRALTVGALLYFYLALSLRQFPWTRELATQLVDLILNPLRSIGEAMLQYLPNLVFLIALAYIVRLALKFASAFFNSVASGSVVLPQFDPDWARPTYNVVRIVAILFALVVAYPYLPGSGTAAFQGVSIFAGLMLSLGASSYMASIIAGYTLTYRRVFRVGEMVKLGEFVGTVTAVRLLVTHLQTPKNEEIIVPNSLVLQSQVLNYSRLLPVPGLILHTMVGIGYEAPWRQVEAMLVLAAERTPGMCRNPPPFVLVRALDDFAVKYELNVFVDSAQHMLARRSALHKNILDVFNEHGVQIMTPAYEEDPAQPKLVPVERWYDAPAMDRANRSGRAASEEYRDETTQS